MIKNSGPAIPLGDQQSHASEVSRSSDTGLSQSRLETVQGPALDRHSSGSLAAPEVELLSPQLRLHVKGTERERELALVIREYYSLNPDAFDYAARTIQAKLTREIFSADSLQETALTLKSAIAALPLSRFAPADMKPDKRQKLAQHAFELVYPELLKEFRQYTRREDAAVLVERIRHLRSAGLSLPDALAVTQLHRETYDRWQKVLAPTEERAVAARVEVRRASAPGMAPAPTPEQSRSAPGAFTFELFGISVRDIELSTRLQTVLEEGKVATVLDLLSQTREEFLRMRRFGKDSFREIRDGLEKKHPVLRLLFQDFEELGVPPEIRLMLESKGIRTLIDLIRVPAHKIHVDVLERHTGYYNQVITAIEPIRMAVQMNFPESRGSEERKSAD